MATRMLGRVAMVLALAGLNVGGAAAESPEVATECAGVSSEARATSFLEWTGVSAPKRITRIVQVGKAPMHRTAGVQLFVPAREGLSEAGLDRIVGCQIALAAEQGGTGALGLPGIRAEVERKGDGYRVRLTSSSVETAQELVRRTGR